MSSLNAIVLGFSILTGLSGCNKPSGPPDPNLKSSLVGRWEESDGKRTYEFSADGKVNLGTKGSPGAVTPYAYEWIGPHRIEWKQNIEGGGIPGARATVSIDSDELTMNIVLLTADGRERSDGGGVSKFKRVKQEVPGR